MMPRLVRSNRTNNLKVGWGHAVRCICERCGTKAFRVYKDEQFGFCKNCSNKVIPYRDHREAIKLSKAKEEYEKINSIGRFSLNSGTISNKRANGN